MLQVCNAALLKAKASKKHFSKHLATGVGHSYHITTFHRTTTFVKYLSRATSENVENLSG